MADLPEVETVQWASKQHGDREDQEIRRANARLRHFRGVAAGVMGEAQRLWLELWEELQDPRSPEEILEGGDSPRIQLTAVDRDSLLDKLHLLGIQIDYARRLCEGSIGSESHAQGDP